MPSDLMLFDSEQEAQNYSASLGEGKSIVGAIELTYTDGHVETKFAVNRIITGATIDDMRVEWLRDDGAWQ